MLGSLKLTIFFLSYTMEEVIVVIYVEFIPSSAGLIGCLR